MANTLKVKCILGALYVPERGYVNGVHARDFTQQDPSNQLPQNYFYQQNSFITSSGLTTNDTAVDAAGRAIPKISQRLRSIPQLGAGLSLTPNRFIGAPLSTFVFAGIKPNVAHPVLNLIKGPSSSYRRADGNVGTYSFTADSELANVGTVGDGSSSSQYTVPTTEVRSVDYPIVPSTKNARWPDAPEVVTYNIWEHVNINAQDIKYTTYKGYKYPSGYDGPTIRQTTDADGTCSLEIAAQNSQLVLRRIYPISQDSLYANAKLYYAIPNGSYFSRPIQARGGANTGFQMHFRHGAPSAATNPLYKANSSSIRVRWGDINPSRKKVISAYELVLVPGQTPELYFLHPTKNEWVSFPLKGPVFGSGSFSVYVHYAGPVLLIGFDEDVSGWNAFGPLNDENDYNSKIDHYISKDAEVLVSFNNITSGFKYGGIAFNNYHPEYAYNGSFDTTSDQGFVRVKMTCPASKAQVLNPDTVNQYFQQHRYLGPTQQDFEKSFERNASYYGDWRSASDELVFTGSVSRDANTGNDSVDTSTLSGFVGFYTTIEGPVFFNIMNPDSGTATQNQGASTVSINTQQASVASSQEAGQDNLVNTRSIVQPLLWGDVSEYINSSINIQYETDLENSSRLSSSVSVSLHNLGTDERGSRILEALENNMLTLTISAGYEDENVYFQGVITKVETTRKGDGMTTMLTAQDVATKCLGDIPFLNVLYFGGLRYGRIIDYAMGCSGFADYYRREPGSAAFTRAMNNRLNSTPLNEGAASKLLNAYPTTPILSVLEPALELVRGGDSLPILYWDYNAQQVVVGHRYSANYRDSLRFLATPTAGNVTFLPQAGGAHGLLTDDGYKISTSTQQLVAGYILWGANAFDSSVDTATRFFPEAHSVEALRLLQTSPRNGRGYVGYRRLIVEKKGAALPDKKSLERWASLMEPFIRNTYQDISFDCYVVRPLNHYGHFNIETFDGSSRSNTTDFYLYKSVTYNIDTKNNIIKAAVQGEKFPFMSNALRTNLQSLEGEDL